VRAQYLSRGKLWRARANAPFWIVWQSFNTFRKNIENNDVGSEDERVYSDDSCSVQGSIVGSKSAKETCLLWESNSYLRISTAWLKSYVYYETSVLTVKLRGRIWALQNSIRWKDFRVAAIYNFVIILSLRTELHIGVLISYNLVTAGCSMYFPSWSSTLPWSVDRWCGWWMTCSTSQAATSSRISEHQFLTHKSK
jgi:hypothetical protein